MGDEGRKEAGDESWTDVEDAPPDMVEVLPIRHGMVLGGRYAIERIIGRGGSGVVVRAHDRDLNQVVAIKIVRAELAGQRVWATRLAREVRLARQINHPNVSRVFDFQQADGRVFLVMELATGTLRDEIRTGQSKARPAADRIRDARAVASALAAIHAAGIVHRDLSPQNLLRLADGRLALSDFGLATDTSESTSVHGGTIAYMAPEVMRGERSSPASDIWSLGALIYEIVFADKPRWSDGASPQIRTPALGRKLTPEERAALDTSRACTAREPGKRLASAAEAERMLAEPRRWRLPPRALARRPIVWAGALTLLVAGGIGAVRTRHQRSVARPPAEPAVPLIAPTGEPADWTDRSVVLAEVPDRIHCTRLLPDQRTLRFVWGTPRQAEDIDTVTRRRAPSQLVPDAYAEGCPDTSPDGRRLVYQGHANDGRPFAFVSERPDGRDAVPIVQTAEPSMTSEPTWLGDGDSFTFDVDTKRMGVFSLGARHTKVLPEPMREPYSTSFRSVVDDLIFVNAIAYSGLTEFVGFSWPSLREELRFRADEFALDVHARGPRIFFALSRKERLAEMVEVDRRTYRARRLGMVRGQLLRYPVLVRDGLTFASLRAASDLVVRSGSTAKQISHGGDVLTAAHCGPHLIVTRERDGKMFVELLDRSGKSLGRPIGDAGALSPGCSPDGKIIYYVDTSSWHTKRCDQSGCRDLIDHRAQTLEVSPDGRRLVVLSFEPRGLVVWVMDSDGRGAHDLREVESACAPGWASTQTVWISRRRGKDVVWVEVDADTGRDTGKIAPSGRDCSDGREDPQSPVNPDLRIVYDQRSQLRLAGNNLLGRN